MLELWQQNKKQVVSLLILLLLLVFVVGGASWLVVYHKDINVSFLKQPSSIKDVLAADIGPNWDSFRRTYRESAIGTDSEIKLVAGVG